MLKFLDKLWGVYIVKELKKPWIIWDVYFNSLSILMTVIVRFVLALLRLRYTISVKGLDLLNKDSAHLILPSHVALMDPVLLYCILRTKISLHPVATRKFYDTLFLKPLFKLLGTIPVEDFEKDQGGIEDAEKLMKTLKEQLQQGENVLLYPQWTLARQWYQSIIGKKSAFYACQAAPKDTKILAVSLRGLWGSRSSTAWNGKSPNLFLFLLKWVFFYIVNLFVLLPKREITIEISDVSKELRQAEKAGLDIFNIALEKIYNAKGEESISYVSAFWAYNTVAHHLPPSKIEWALDTLRKKVDYSQLKYPKDTLHYIEQKIFEIKPEYQWTIDLDTNLVLDLYFDSLDMAELKSSVAAHFPNASNPPLLDLKAVGDVVLMAMGKSPYVEELKPCDWKYPKNSHSIYSSLKKWLTKEDTILTMLKKSFRQDSSLSICYDQLFGVQSRTDFMIKAYLIADILKTFPWKNIAIMLPSLSATALLIIASYLAEKIPVMLNWTQSEEAFAHCIESQDISVILTAWSFYKKIQTPWLQRYEMTFFEELLKEVSLKQKIKALIQSKFFSLPRDLDPTAVVLFTSWSESLPKAVALSHQNILQDIVGALWLLEIHYDDILFAFLPPFHSFWFTVNTILPLISGIRAVYMPDPNDAAMINNLIQHTNSSVVASTPTFLKGFFAPAHHDQLSSLRLAVVGAEKAPEELFALATSKAKWVTLVEGYGITECSPIIAANPFSPKKQVKRGSVGLPIVGAQVKILDVETSKELWAKKEGMIYVAGAFVFNGYLDPSLESPFLMIDKKKYYKTWDLWFLDKDWYLYISGRLKRFVKIAGEMISLPALETTLLEKYGEDDQVSIALEAKEYGDGSVKFVVFSIHPLDTSSINSYLREKGVSNLVKIKEVIVLDEIPLLGTWKTDFMKLRGMIV